MIFVSSLNFLLTNHIWEVLSNISLLPICSTCRGFVAVSMQSITSWRNGDCGFTLCLFAASWMAICTSWRTCSQTLLVVSTTSSRAVCERRCLSFSFIKRPAATSLEMKWGFSGTVCWESEPGWSSSNAGSSGSCMECTGLSGGFTTINSEWSPPFASSRFGNGSLFWYSSEWAFLMCLYHEFACWKDLGHPRTPHTRRKRSWEWAARTTYEVIETDIARFAQFALPYIRRIGCHRLIILQLAPAIRVTWSRDISRVFIYIINYAHMYTWLRHKIRKSGILKRRMKVFSSLQLGAHLLALVTTNNLISPELRTLLE